MIGVQRWDGTGRFKFSITVEVDIAPSCNDIQTCRDSNDDQGVI